jgi:hypothetical protein
MHWVGALAPTHSRRKRGVKMLRFLVVGFLLAFLAPLALHAAWWLLRDPAPAWHEADWSSAQLLPPARSRPEALVHVYAARTGRWKGIFAHHSWIVTKERGAASYMRFDMVAWGQPVKINNWAPDARWYGHRPILVGAIEGPPAQRLIPQIRAAIARYPYDRSGAYAVWPGPNSNSFVCYVLAEVPEIGIALPPTALGKDWRALPDIIGLTPSRTGIRLSLGGFFGFSIGWVEGLEINVLGLVAGIDLRRPALKIPGFGRIGIDAILA